MTRTIASTLLALACCQAAGADQPFRGHFEGAGHTCLGQLTVDGASLAWKSVINDCPATPYKVIEQGDDKAPLLVLQVGRPEQCGFGIIKLELSNKQNNTWTATGFISYADFKNPRLPPYQKLECELRKTDS